MDKKATAEQLEEIVALDSFLELAEELVAQWSQAPDGDQAIEPILRFMERHPEVDYGMPGPLVHFLEGYFKRGYEERLVESVDRCPTPHTVWMLNRVINGTKNPREREALIAVLRTVGQRPATDAQMLERVHQFVERLERGSR